MSKLPNEARNRAWSSCRGAEQEARQSLARGGEIDARPPGPTWSEPASVAKVSAALVDSYITIAI